MFANKEKEEWESPEDSILCKYETSSRLCNLAYTGSHRKNGSTHTNTYLDTEKVCSIIISSNV